MALLLDLPPTVRRDLAERWQTEETTASLYRAMTDPAELDRQLAALGPVAGRTLAVLARRPATHDDLLAHLPQPAEAVDAALLALAQLGLIARAPLASPAPGRAGVPSLAYPRVDQGTLYVPPDLGAALARIGDRRG